MMLASTLDEYSRLLLSLFSPLFLSIWLSQPDAGVQEPDATVSTHPKYSQARSYTTYAWVYV